LNAATRMSVHTHVSLINGSYSGKPAFIFVMKPVFSCMLHTFYLCIVKSPAISTWGWRCYIISWFS